jgi:hypothetical protein
LEVFWQDSLWWRRQFSILISCFSDIKLWILMGFVRDYTSNINSNIWNVNLTVTANKNIFVVW